LDSNIQQYYEERRSIFTCRTRLGIRLLLNLIGILTRVPAISTPRGSDVCCGVHFVAELHLFHIDITISKSTKILLTMSSPPISPIRRAWYRWKALRLPWRKRFLVGKLSSSKTSRYLISHLRSTSQAYTNTDTTQVSTSTVTPSGNSPTSSPPTRDACAE
jgi:hypothetical protein